MAEKTPTTFNILNVNQQSFSEREFEFIPTDDKGSAIVETNQKRADTLALIKSGSLKPEEVDLESIELKSDPLVFILIGTSAKEYQNLEKSIADKEVFQPLSAKHNGEKSILKMSASMTEEADIRRCTVLTKGFKTNSNGRISASIAELNQFYTQNPVLKILVLSECKKRGELVAGE